LLRLLLVLGKQDVFSPTVPLGEVVVVIVEVVSSSMASISAVITLLLLLLLVCSKYRRGDGVEFEGGDEGGVYVRAAGVPPIESSAATTAEVKLVVAWSVFASTLGANKMRDFVAEMNGSDICSSFSPGVELLLLPPREDEEERDWD